MPPRRSDASKIGTGDEGTPGKDRDNANGSGGLGVEDLSLPRTMVQRLAKGVLPPNTQIHKDAVLAMSKSATVFVSYLSAQANENAHRSLKKTISPDHVLEALSELEFESFLPRLKLELAKYNEVQTEKRNTYRKKASLSQTGSGGLSASASQPDGADEAAGAFIDSTTLDDRSIFSKHLEGDDAPPATKKVRISDANGLDSSRQLSEEDDDDDTLEEDTGTGLDPEVDVDSDDVGDVIEDEEDQEDEEQLDRLEGPDEDAPHHSKEDEALHDGADSD